MARNLMENGHPWGRLVQRFLARPSPKAYWLWMMRLSMYARYVFMMAFGKTCSESNWRYDFSDHSVETLAEVGGSASERTVILEITFNSKD